MIIPSVKSYQPPTTRSIYREGMAVDGLGDQIENNVPSVTSYQPPTIRSIYREGMAVDGLGDQIENNDYNEFLTLFKDGIKSVQTDSKKNWNFCAIVWERTHFNW